MYLYVCTVSLETNIAFLPRHVIQTCLKLVKEQSHAKKKKKL
jgi:hypothetical protein